MKTLYLHVGFPKTGSSFLQVVFARNATFFRETFGLDYLQPDTETAALAAEGRITSGNGQWFLAQVSKGEDVAAALQPYLSGPSDKTLISTENWNKLPEEVLAAVKEQAAVQGYDVRAIAFVRDPFELAISAYLQGVKRGIVSKPLEASTRNFKYQHALHEDLIGAHYPLDLIDYDANRDRLVEAFFERLGLDGALVPDVPEGTVNRSVSAEECAFLIRLNGQHQDKSFARHVSDYLVERFPFSGTPVTHTEQSFAHVAASIGADAAAEAEKRGFKSHARPLDPEAFAQAAFRVQEALCGLAMTAKAEEQAMRRLLKRRVAGTGQEDVALPDAAGSEEELSLALMASRRRNLQLRARLVCLDALALRRGAARQDAILAACKPFTAAGDYGALAAFLDGRGEPEAAYAVCLLAESKDLGTPEIKARAAALVSRVKRPRLLGRLRRR